MNYDLMLTLEGEVSALRPNVSELQVIDIIHSLNTQTADLRFPLSVKGILFMTV